ncbi:MGDG synthase family glycosyltransferase [Cohnella abietis]|uniref:Processive diacylglycerol beta-glucosyltransferase n=1 Tax=Cohnella abietis TaxID=2507935 RepID=A0A3T1D080_9BACL|nr:glycosyltransferase [Cohnella abietis]BBI31478.1 processive diacylglycerol beta-glucosyltransferase [Cohnella abietis]
MTGQRKVLIVYARFGEGHWQAAVALKHSFVTQGNCEVKLIDLLAESHPLLNEVSRFVYKSSYHMFPQVYGWVYEATKEMKTNSLFTNWLHSFGAMTLQKLIMQEKPDAVIHTFPLLVLPSVSSKIGRKIPMFNVITDFDLHSRWIHPDVDKYYVATEDLSKELHSLGIDSSRIAATGIPLRFSLSPDKTTRFATPKYGLSSHKPIVLVMAGASGTMADIDEWCLKLVKLSNVQVVIVCGRNRALENSLKNKCSENDDITVYGYIEQIDELMSISSCIVTKPGGLTLSEAIRAELPMFLYRPVPGQERNNARYLENKGAAIICHNSSELLTQINKLFCNSLQQIMMHQALHSLSKKAASDSIAFDIIHQLNIMEEASSSPVRI